MSKKVFSAVGITLLSLVLAGCDTARSNQVPTAAPKDQSGSSFNPQKVMQRAPGFHTTVSLDELRALVESGQAVQIDGTEDAQVESSQRLQLQSALSGLNVSNPELAGRLQAVASNPANTEFQFVDNKGHERTVLLQGAEEIASDFLSAAESAGSAGDQQRVYEMIYQAAPAEVQRQLTAPGRLGAQSADTIADKRALAEELLKSYYAQHPSTFGVQTVGQSLSAQGEGAGTGQDITGTCGAYYDQGIIKNIAFPLRDFLTVPKDQGRRNICWAFAAMSAVETVESVVNDRQYNLSEQYFNAGNRHNVGQSARFEGGNVTASLNIFLRQGLLIPDESAWTYNNGRSRTNKDNFAGICDSYDGWCSETASQFPIKCDPTGSLCAEEKLNLGGIASRKTYNLWLNNFGEAAPIASFKNLLDNGTPLVFSFDVFMDGMDEEYGFVHVPRVPNVRGGHAVLMVGYIDSANLKAAVPSAPVDMNEEGYFIVKNSWGCDWGDSGYFYMPYSYIDATGRSVAVLEDGGVRSDRWKDRDAKLLLTPATAEVNVGDPVDFQLMRELDQQPAKVSAQWTVSDPALAELTAVNGNAAQLVARAAGQVQVTATTTGGQQHTAVVTIKAPVPQEPPCVVTSVRTNLQRTQLRVGATAQLTATPVLSDPNCTNKPDLTVTWTSSNPARARVDAQGQVTAVSSGYAVITATIGDKSASTLVSISR